MKAKFGETTWPPAATPLGEAGHAVEDALGAYFQTHPPSEERARRLSEMVVRNHKTLAGRIVYDGVRNYQARIPRTRQKFVGEQYVY
jgi:hypothetical protein